MSNRLGFLDITRGLAALSVVCIHMDTSYLNKNGSLFGIIQYVFTIFLNIFWVNGGMYPGVIIFIVLSGFCIHLPQAKKRNLDLNIIEFAHKRFFRIYPVLIVAYVLGIIANTISEHGNSSSIENVINNLLFISALLPLQPPSGNPVLHTVIVECVLYCCYPFGLKLLKSTSWIVLLFGCFSLYILNTSWLFLSSADPVWIQRNICSLLCYWWIGAFAVELCYGRWAHALIKGIHCILLYLVYFIFCFTVHFKGIHFINSLLLAIVVAFFLMFFFQKNKRKVVNYNISNLVLIRIRTVFMKIGEMSYSLYVVHVPVFTLTNYYFFQEALLHEKIFYCVNLLIITISTVLLYRLVEKPSHQHAQKYKQNSYLPSTSS